MGTVIPATRRRSYTLLRHLQLARLTPRSRREHPSKRRPPSPAAGRPASGMRWAMIERRPCSPISSIERSSAAVCTGRSSSGESSRHAWSTNTSGHWLADRQRGELHNFSSGQPRHHDTVVKSPKSSFKAGTCSHADPPFGLALAAARLCDSASSPRRPAHVVRRAARNGSTFNGSVDACIVVVCCAF